MIGTLWTGISGLSSHQKALDNESNNIANVNTIGFKSSRISFADMMYQDQIGKGSKVLDAEKLYTQGNLKLTGMNYDMALSGDGFFTVANKSSSGTSENFYTRAGNFRMGDNGTLQDSAGNEVQGWMMSSIDTDNDVTTTNPNVNVFTDDYSKILGSEIIRHGTYVETITAKATDYLATAKSDPSSIFSGDGAKTKSSKISDVELAIVDYSNWLQKLKDEPDGASSSSTAQISQINFKSGSESIIGKTGDQIYVYIDGNKYSQNFLSTTATSELKADLFAYDSITYPDLTGLNGTALETANFVYDKAAGKIATYKALADKISQIPGLVATMAKEVGGTADALELGDTFTASTKNIDMINGIIQITSLIPGREFIVSEIAEVSGLTKVKGTIQNQTLSQKGSGIGAVETSRDALSELITGKQQDVYTKFDLKLTNSTIFKYSINIYDKELKQNIPIPNDGGTPPSAVPIFINALSSSNTASIDDIVNAINEGKDEEGTVLSPKLTDYIEAQNINGNLVIKTLDKNYDIEFSNSLNQLPSYNINLNEIVDNSEYSFDLKVNNIDYPITIAFPTSSLVIPSPYTDIYEYIRDQVKAEVDTINTNNPTYLLNITPNINGAFSIYTANEDIDFDNSGFSVVDTLPSVSSIDIQPLGTPSLTYEKDKITITEPLSNIVYSIDIMGETISYDNTLGVATSANEIINDFKTQISLNTSLSSLVDSNTPSNTLGSNGSGVILSNGLSSTQSYGSLPAGKFMIEIPSGTTDLTLYLDEISADDTFQVFTKSGKHIIGTPQGNSSWTLGNTPSNIISNNLGKYFDLNATYLDELSSPSISNFYSGSNPSGGSYSYIDKNGNAATKVLTDSNEELITIPNVSEDLVVFINGSGSYLVSAEWGISGASITGSSSLLLEQNGLINSITPTGLEITNLNGVTSNSINSFNYEARYEHRFDITTDDNKSSSIYNLVIEGKTFDIKTDQTPTVNEIVNAFNNELSKDIDMNEKFEIILDGTELVIRDKFGEFGYVGFTQDSKLTIKSLTIEGDKYKTLQTSNNKILTLDKNADYSGSEGAGAEFLEIINKVDQTASKGSLQLRLDTLEISDSAFGEFSVDSTGLITMKQDGVNFAIGQAAIATFNNNRGLNPIGNNLLAKTNESGDPIYNINNDKTAKIEARTLELSTSDLSESLVNLMIFQRAFEANAKSITTSDDLLNTLLNLKK